MDKFRKVITIGLLMVFMCMSLSGCCLSHEWQEATCDTPKTCTACGSTEGEALAHNWAGATCTTPKTCTACGSTEGEALTHNWAEATCTTPKTCTVCGSSEGGAGVHTLTEANYQTAASCTVCGATEGAPLQADFEKYGFECYDAASVVGQNFSYTTICYEAPECLTTGQASLISYEKISSDETHEALEGYEWIIAEIEILYNDEYAWGFGMSTQFCTEDYYTIKEHDDSMVYNEDNSATYTVSFNGQDYTECKKVSSAAYQGWTEFYTNTYFISVGFRVPVGYDGTVVGLLNGVITWGEGQYLYDLDHSDTIFFRFQ